MFAEEIFFYYVDIYKEKIAFFFIFFISLILKNFIHYIYNFLLQLHYDRSFEFVLINVIIKFRYVVAFKKIDFEISLIKIHLKLCITIHLK